MVGAGLAGLAAAAELTLRGHEVQVFEASSRVGGVARSERRNGYLVERGPNTFRVPGAALPFFERHGLLDAIERAAPASRKRFLFRNGRLEPVPDGLLAFARTPLLSTRGKLRLLAEPFVRRGSGKGESVASFVERRLGREASEALVGPFLTGVYAGDETRLGAEAVFPRLVAAEARGGSITWGLLVGERTPKGLPGSWSGRGGSAALPETLSERIRGQVRCGIRCAAVGPSATGLRIDFEQEPGVTARAVVVATTAPAAADILRHGFPDAAERLEQIVYAPVVNLSLGLPRTATGRPIEGFGFLVPRGELETLLGCLFPSQLFTGRAPEGAELLTAFAGGARRPDLLEWDDATLARAIEGDLDRALELREDPLRLGIARWSQAIPQPGPQHPRIVSELKSSLARAPSLALAGGYLQGVAVADALLSGECAAVDLSAVLRGESCAG